MKPIVKLILIGGLSVVLFDALASVASLQLDFPYSSAGAGSYIIYGAFGFIAGRAGGWKGGASVGAALGFVDATLGWAVSWIIGPGKPPTDMAFTPMMWLVVAISVCLGAAICGALGGALGRATNRMKPQSA